MRTITSLSTVITLLATLNSVQHLCAVPITGDTGPGGIGQLSVSGNVTDAGPLLWLNADDLVGSVLPTNKVNTWTDSSGNGNDAIADAGSLNTFQNNVQNGRPAVNLPGASGAREFNAGAITGRSFIGTLRLDTGTPFNCCDGVFGQISSDTGLRYRLGGWEVTGQIGNAGVDVDGTGAIAAPVNQWHTFTALSSGAGAAHTNFGIGQYFSVGDRELHGDIGEAIVYEQTLNSAQRQVLNSYSAAKYDFSVTNDRYDGDSPGNGDYDIDVFGIGRVDSSNIFDNTGSNGLGFEDTGSTLTDGDFLLAGHNVESNSLTELGVPAGEAKRMQRVWYVDRTDVDNGLIVEMSFDFSDGGIAVGAIESASLLFSSIDSPFSFNIVGGLTTTIDGDTVTFGVPAGTLVDGYYTIAISQVVPEPSSCLLLGLGVLGLMRQTRRRRRA